MTWAEIGLLEAISAEVGVMKCWQPQTIELDHQSCLTGFGQWVSWTLWALINTLDTSGHLRTFFVGFEHFENFLTLGQY